MPDADLDMATNALMGASYGSAGERCMAVSVAVPVTDAVADALVEKLKPKIKALKIGPAMDPSSEMGPLVTAQHLQKVTGYIDSGEREGADVIVDGRSFKQDKQGYENGFFIGGTLLDNVQEDMSCYREEIFGPVVTMIPFTTEEEVIKMANSTKYGLSASIFTENVSKAHRVAANIDSVSYTHLTLPTNREV